MRVTGNALVSDYREGEKRTVNEETGEASVRKWARLDFADGLSVFCDQGTLNGEADQLDGVTMLKVRVDLDIKSRGRATVIDLRSIEVLDTVEV